MKNLKKARLKMKFTQAEMASQLHLSTTAYQFYEMGRNEPSIGTLKRISEILHVTVDYLIDNDTTDFVDINEFRNEIDSVIELLEKMKENI